MCVLNKASIEIGLCKAPRGFTKSLEEGVFTKAPIEKEFCKVHIEKGLCKLPRRFIHTYMHFSLFPRDTGMLYKALYRWKFVKHPGLCKVPRVSIEKGLYKDSRGSVHT